MPIQKKIIQKSYLRSFTVYHKQLELLRSFKISILKDKSQYECVFSGCDKVCKNFFRWKIHYNKHVRYSIVLKLAFVKFFEL